MDCWFLCRSKLTSSGGAIVAKVPLDTIDCKMVYDRVLGMRVELAPLSREIYVRERRDFSEEIVYRSYVHLKDKWWLLTFKMLDMSPMPTCFVVACKCNAHTSNLIDENNAYL